MQCLPWLDTCLSLPRVISSCESWNLEIFAIRRAFRLSIVLAAFSWSLLFTRFAFLFDGLKLLSLQFVKFYKSVFFEGSLFFTSSRSYQDQCLQDFYSGAHLEDFKAIQIRLWLLASIRWASFAGWIFMFCIKVFCCLISLEPSIIASSLRFCIEASSSRPFSREKLSSLLPMWSAVSLFSHKVGLIRRFS